MIMITRRAFRFPIMEKVHSVASALRWTTGRCLSLVRDGQIIYIGETAGLRQRFNMGYGNISPRNCYVGGQSTNCKMNKIVPKLA